MRDWRPGRLPQARGFAAERQCDRTGRYDPSLPLAFRIAELFDLPIEEIFVSPSRNSSKAI